MDDSDSLLVHPAQSFYHPYARPRNFLTLPAELRMMVYYVLLILPEINFALKRSNIKPKLSLGILRTCRQIYYEASMELCRHKIFGALRGYHHESLSTVIRHFGFNGFSCSAVGRIEKFRFLADLRLNIYGLIDLDRSGFVRLIRKTFNGTNIESKDTSDFIDFASQKCRVFNRESSSHSRCNSLTLNGWILKLVEAVPGDFLLSILNRSSQVRSCFPSKPKFSTQSQKDLKPIWGSRWDW